MPSRSSPANRTNQQESETFVGIHLRHLELFSSPQNCPDAFRRLSQSGDSWGKVFYDDSDGRLGVEETRRGGSQMGRDRRESVGSAARQRLPRREMDSLNNLLPDAVVCYFLLFSCVFLRASLLFSAAKLSCANAGRPKSSPLPPPRLHPRDLH